MRSHTFCVWQAMPRTLPSCMTGLQVCLLASSVAVAGVGATGLASSASTALEARSDIPANAAKTKRRMKKPPIECDTDKSAVGLFERQAQLCVSAAQRHHIFLCRNARKDQPAFSSLA